MRNRTPGEAMVKLEPISANPEYAELASTIATYEKRLTESIRRRERATAIVRGAKSGKTLEEQAELLVRGAQVAGIDPFREIDAADREISLMRDAIRKKTEALDELVGDLSVELCRRLQPEHTALLKAAVAAMAEMNRCFTAAAEIRAKIRSAGYLSVAAVLPDTQPPATLALAPNGMQFSMWRDYVKLHTGIEL